MLSHLAAMAAAGSAPMRATFHFEHTDMWEQVGRRGGRERLVAGRAQPGPTYSSDAWLDELRLLGTERYATIVDWAFGRALGLEEARRQGVRATDGLTALRATQFRAARGLRTDEALDAWLRAQHLSREAFQDAMADEVRLEQVRALFEPDTARQMCEVLRHDGAYDAFHVRAQAKQALLVRHGVEHIGREDSGLTEAALLARYFEGLLGASVPADVDACAAGVGCADRHVFLQVLLREWWFRRLLACG